MLFKCGLNLCVTNIFLVFQPSMPEQHAASQPDLWQLRLMIAAQAFGFVRKL
jgi:hypothetical protein